MKVIIYIPLGMMPLELGPIVVNQLVIQEWLKKEKKLTF